MVSTLFIGADRVFLAMLCILNLLALTRPVPARGDAAVPSALSYCSVPPLAGTGVKPNLLLMIDNSASMYDPAYTDTSTPPKYCLDDSYNSALQYPGYFDQGATYSYNFATESFETGSYTLPSTSCSNETNKSDLCVHTVPAYTVYDVPINAVDSFLASGKFLNWLTMSKLDIEKMALTGGKLAPGETVNGIPTFPNGLLQAETRGCQGKRFIKMSGGFTFAVRGPILSENDYASQGGSTRIEVYANSYNKSACLAAVAALQGSSQPNLTAAALLCMGQVTDEQRYWVPSIGKVHTEIASYCYSTQYELSMSPEEKRALVTALREDCMSRIQFSHSDTPEQILKNDGDDICAYVQHTVTSSGDYGYLGLCYLKGDKLEIPEGCAQVQIDDYCLDNPNPPLTDLSASLVLAGANANLPGFILEAGLYNLERVGTLQARIALAPGATPKGLIQGFSNAISFGAMVFNDNGAGSECAALPGGCGAGTATDGAKIISDLSQAPFDNLIASINAVRATSWTPLAESFYEAIGYFAGRTELRLQSADFAVPASAPASVSCQRNNILIMTDGVSTADRAPAVSSWVAERANAWVNANDANGMPASLTTASTDPYPPFRGSYNLDDLAWIARNKNISKIIDFSGISDPGNRIRDNRDFISTYVVYTGAPGGAPQGIIRNADGSCAALDETLPQQMMQLAACKGGGMIASAKSPVELAGAIGNLFQLIGSGSNSGTDVSILSTGDANGAIFLQEQFYPNKSFGADTTSVSWIGEMQGLWYYIDPFIGSTGMASSIREDSNGASDSPRNLALANDRVVHFSFDDTLQKTKAELYFDADGDGTRDPGSETQFVTPDEVQSLWRAGLKLWERDADSRTIYTQIDGQHLVPFLDSANAVHQKLLQAADATEADAIVKFVRGTDGPSTRARKVRAAGSTPREWKLGDIISSTPALQSALSLSSHQLPPPRGYSDLSYRRFVNYSGAYQSTMGAYQKRGTVYVGANDGMLHAFRLGSLRAGSKANLLPGQKAALSGSDLGREEWAFVPRNALPYLRYLKEPGYPHLYYVDGGITLTDVSLGDPADPACDRASYWNCPKDDEHGTNWRTVLIGGMGQGGATCLDNASGSCVQAPPQIPGQPTIGLSSYFALDVTDQTSDGHGVPKLLWEFSDPGLGYATSGPAIIRVKASNPPGGGDDGKNGRWFAVFASGPTGPIDASCQFLGQSAGQTMKLFVVDLNAAPPLNHWVINTGISNAFGGSMSGAGIDSDRWDPSKPGYYEDDALYLGYSKLADDNTWTGGVLRLLIKGDPGNADSSKLNPANWSVSSVIDGVGPVTGAVSKLQDRGRGKLWLYFGTGRYFFNKDDMTSGRALFGVTEPCYKPSSNSLDTNCSVAPLVQQTDLGNATPSASGSTGSKGWWIDLDAGGSGSERVTASPTASTNGSVFFTTFQPSTDACQQGLSYLWRVRYDSGGSVAASIYGQALMQLSNGSTREIPLNWTNGNRRSDPMPGKAAGVKLVTNSGLRPLKKIIHMQER